MRARLDELGITQVQYSILATTAYLATGHDPVSQQDIANTLEMDKMMISDIMKTLEAQSLVSRNRSATDGRSFVLHVTRAGRDMLARATPAAEAVDEAFFGVLAKAERQRLVSCLQRLV